MARLVYEKYHKDLVSDANHTVVDYTCCPGWTQVNWRSHGCNKPVCSPRCANGGKCVKPNVCNCPPGYDGSYCENKISVYAAQNSRPVGSRASCPAFPTTVCPVTCPCCNMCPSIYLPMDQPALHPCTCNYCNYCKGYSYLSPRDKRNGLQDQEYECVPPCQNGGTCNKNPVMVCVCPPGYAGKQCERDVDECKENKPCDQICYNTPGSYKCECKENFALQKDGQTCRRESDDEGLEAKDLEQHKLDKLDKRIQKLEKMMKEKSKNEVTKHDLNNIYENIHKMSTDISYISNKLERLILLSGVKCNSTKTDFKEDGCKLCSMKNSAESVEPILQSQTDILPSCRDISFHCHPGSGGNSRTNSEERYVSPKMCSLSNSQKNIKRAVAP